MTYSSSIEWAEAELIFWSKDKVLDVLTDHGHTLDDDTLDDLSYACQPAAITESGGRYFQASDVLRWLGY